VTTSGTASFNLNLTEIVEEAFERAGGELRSGYDLRTARRSLNLLFADWANRGLNMFTFEQGSIPLVPGVATYALPNDTVDLLEHVIRTGAGNAATQSDLSLTRISISTYATIPNKLQQARPIQLLVNRNSGAEYPVTGVNNPSVTLWPVPDNSQQYTLVYWRLRRIQDAGNGTNTFDIPFRFLPCLVAGLAYYLALKIPEGYPRLVDLKVMYDEAWEVAATEDREKAAIRLVPRRQYVSNG
jgi:hypothetical protein